MTLGNARRARLLAAMAEADIAGLVLYGNAWQGDYLRYAADFGILEGHGIAVVSSDATVDLFLDSATEAERAEAELSGVTVRFETDIARAVAARLERMANHRLLAAPRRALPSSLVSDSRGVELGDGTAFLDNCPRRSTPSAARRSWPMRPTRHFARQCGRAVPNTRWWRRSSAICAAAAVRTIS
jgi:Xaa-Pro dipeptidase